MRSRSRAGREGTSRGAGIQIDPPAAAFVRVHLGSRNHLESGRGRGAFRSGLAGTRVIDRWRRVSGGAQCVFRPGCPQGLLRTGRNAAAARSLRMHDETRAQNLVSLPHEVAGRLPAPSDSASPPRRTFGCGGVRSHRRGCQRHRGPATGTLTARHQLRSNPTGSGLWLCRCTLRHAGSRR